MPPLSTASLPPTRPQYAFASHHFEGNLRKMGRRSQAWVSRYFILLESGVLISCKRHTRKPGASRGRSNYDSSDEEDEGDDRAFNTSNPRQPPGAGGSSAKYSFDGAKIVLHLTPGSRLNHTNWGEGNGYSFQIDTGEKVIPLCAGKPTTE